MDSLSSKPQTDCQWRCDQCGELHAPQFDSCWKCGAECDADQLKVLRRSVSLRESPRPSTTREKPSSLKPLVFVGIRISATFFILLGLVLANLLGFGGFWLSEGVSDAAIDEQLQDDWTQYLKNDPNPNYLTFFEFGHTEVRRSRVHGWPLRWLSCDYMTQFGPAFWATSSAWAFDGAEVFEFRLIPLAANTLFAAALSAATFAFIGRFRKRPILRFTIVDLLAVMFAVAVSIQLWIGGVPFGVESTNALVSLAVARVSSFAGVLFLSMICTTVAARGINSMRLKARSQRP